MVPLGTGTKMELHTPRDDNDNWRGDCFGILMRWLARLAKTGDPDSQ
jgi:hypothetical protein